MDDLISRQHVIDALNGEIMKRRLADDINDGRLDEFDTESIIRQLPSIQSKRGHWIMSNVGDTFMTDAPRIIYCSSCNVCAPYATNFCPNCGADMREVTT